jgi:hypothetical protein
MSHDLATSNGSDPPRLGVKFIVGAYAASPTLYSWNPDLEQQYFEGLAGLDSVRGLELPWIGGLHLHDETWLLGHLPDRFDLVVTDVPHTVRRVAVDASFGLGSLHDEGRAAAVLDVARLRDDVHRLADHAGRAAVIAVELHSAPRALNGSAAHLAKSLYEIASWDWAGAALVVEHCDTWVPTHEPAKGWMPLAEEIAAIAGTGVGLSLNWGRSAIELRDGDAVVEQVRQARDSGVLRGMILSGAADQPDEFGAAWEDAHLPFARTDEFQRGSTASLLTLQRAADAVGAAGEIDWLGIKFGWPGREGAIAARVDMIATGLCALTSIIHNQEVDRVR